ARPSRVRGRSGTTTLAGQAPQRGVGAAEGVGAGAGWGVTARKLVAMSSSQPFASCDGSDDRAGIKTYIRPFAGITYPAVSPPLVGSHTSLTASRPSTVTGSIVL